MKNKFLSLGIAVLFSALSFSQSNNFDTEIGVSLKASTNGFGGDIYYRPMKKLAIKAGVEYLSFAITSDRIEKYTDEDVNIEITNQYLDNAIRFATEGKFKTGALSVAVGYQPFKLFYVTAGIGKSLFASDVTGILATDVVFKGKEVPTVGMVKPVIHKDDIGPFVIDIKSKNSIIPYLGIGLGSFVPQNKTVSFAFEIGAYYVGNFNLKHTMPTGFNANNIDFGGNVTQAQKDEHFTDINNELTRVYNDVDTEVTTVINDVNDAIEGFKFYPVLKLTVGFKAFTFKK